MKTGTIISKFKTNKKKMKISANFYGRIKLQLVSTDFEIQQHRTHRFRCPVLKHCTEHKHKVCGSDGKLYASHCHLR